MNFIKVFFSLVLFGLLLASCSDTDQADKTNASATNPKQKKELEVKKPNKKKGNKSASQSYWTQLQTELKLNDQQIKGLKNIKKKYKDLSKAIPHIKGKVDRAKVKTLRQKEKAEIKALLGDDLYAQKIKWDKARKIKK